MFFFFFQSKQLYFNRKKPGTQIIASPNSLKVMNRLFYWCAEVPCLTRETKASIVTCRILKQKEGKKNPADE